PNLGSMDAFGNIRTWNCNYIWAINGSQHVYPVAGYTRVPNTANTWIYGINIYADPCTPPVEYGSCPMPETGINGATFDLPVGNPISTSQGINQQTNTDWQSGLDSRFGLVRYYTSTDDVI